jgi:uncharacterized protein (TIGR02996 family)
MSLEQAFLSDIVEHPDDDAPRLIFADWLDDQGQADRAELIRVQIERAGLEADDRRQPDFKARELVLLRRCKDDILDAFGLDPSLRKPPVEWTFRRGFPEGCRRVSVAGLLEHAEHLIRCVPLRELAPASPRELAADLAASPLLPRLRRLRLRGVLYNPLIEGPELNVLLGTGNLSGLRELDLGHNALTGAELARLWSAPPPQLQALDLGFNHLDGAAMQRLAAAPLDNLRALSLAHATDDEGVALLAESTSLRQVTDLYLGGCLADGNGTALQRLAERGSFPRLQRLSLLGNRISPAAARALVAWPDLRRLHFARPFVLEAFSATDFPALHHLRVLELRGHSLPLHGLTVLLGALRQADLHSLLLNDIHLSRKVVQMLCAWPGLATVHTLALRNTYIDAPDIEALARSPHLKSIRHLDLGGNRLGAAGLIPLFEAPWLGQLTGLLLDGCALDMEAARALLRCEHLDGLAALRLGRLTDLPVRITQGLQDRFAASLW